MNGFGIVQCGEMLCTVQDHRPLANFGVNIVRPLYDPKHAEQLAGLQLGILHNGGHFPLVLDLQLPDLTSQICQQVPTCRVLQPRQKGSLDAYLIQLGVEAGRAGPKTLFFKDHGLYHLPDSRWVYVCGDEVLGLAEDTQYQISHRIARAHLVWDSVQSEQEAVARFCIHLMQHDQILLPVWGFTLCSSLRSCIRQLSITTLPSLAIVGGQNLGKTTLARRYMLLYDDKQRPGRCWAQLDAHSTAAATMDLVSHFRDQVVLVDDLAKSASAAERRARLELISEVLRFASNDTDRVKMSPQKQPEERFCRAGLAFTGEFHLDNPSDVTRLVVIPLQKPLRNGTEEERTLAATSFRYFMRWLLPRLDRELDVLQGMLRNTDGQKSIRMATNYALLQWSIQLFYRFAVDAKAVTGHYEREAISRMEQILKTHLETQWKAVEHQSCTVPRGNLSWYILQGYRAGKFHIVSRDRIRDDGDCVVEHDALCIRADTLLEYFQMATPYRVLTKTDMSRRLMEEGALTKSKECRSAKKKIKGRRYLEFCFAVLKDTARTY